MKIRLFSSKKIIILLLVFVISFAVAYIILKIARFIENDVYRSLLYALLLSLVALILTRVLKQDYLAQIDGKNLLRYSMLCKKCGWEWMSHSISKVYIPTHCPKCGNSNKAKIEIIGWRKFDMASKKDKDLRHFFQ